jgi:hypothetical protein
VEVGRTVSICSAEWWNCHYTFQEWMKPCDYQQPRITWETHRGQNRHARVTRKVLRYMRWNLVALSVSSHRNGRIVKLRYRTFQEWMKPGDCQQPWSAHRGHKRHAQATGKFPRSIRWKLVALAVSSHRNVVKLRYCTF